MLDHGSDMRWDGDDDDIDDDLDIKARPFSAGSTVDLGDGNSTPSSYDLDEEIASPMTPREAQARSRFAKRLADALHISQAEVTSRSPEKCMTPPRPSGRPTSVVGDASLRPAQPPPQHSPLAASDPESPSASLRASPRRVAKWIAMKPSTPALGSPAPHAPLTPRAPGGGSSGPRPPTRRVFQMRKSRESHDGLARVDACARPGQL